MDKEGLEIVLQNMWQKTVNGLAHCLVTQEGLLQKWLENEKEERKKLGPGVIFCSQFATDIMIGEVDPAVTFFPLSKLHQVIPQSYQNFAFDPKKSYIILAMIITSKLKIFAEDIYSYPNARIFSSMFEVENGKIFLLPKLHIDLVTLKEDEELRIPPESVPTPAPQSCKP